LILSSFHLEVGWHLFVFQKWIQAPFSLNLSYYLPCSDFSALPLCFPRILCILLCKHCVMLLQWLICLSSLTKI
jgi:hypothetical protein